MANPWRELYDNIVDVQPINFVFDVDGTLTPSRKAIDPEHKEFLMDWVRGQQAYLLTGSDAEKTIEQLGEDLWRQFTSYQCNGNVTYVDGEKTREKQNGFVTRELIEFLEKELADSKYPKKFSTNIEVRKGMLNFSTVGRDCDNLTRKQYAVWDHLLHERVNICNRIKEAFPGIDAVVGGQISIDIFPEGNDKGQLYDILTGPVYFFCDNAGPTGNDYAMAKKLNLEVDKLFYVSGPEETFEILKSL